MRILLARDPVRGAESLSEYQTRGGWTALERVLGAGDPQAVIAAIAAADLRGRGGAAFPTARKWELARAQAADRKYLVANGGEHEPGSRKDRVLLETHPHTVLEGMALAAFATGAASGFVYLIEDMGAARAAVEHALDEARAAGLLGRRVLGSSFDFEVAITLAPGTYVAGEETAALEVIEGRAPLPRKKPPYPGEAGVHGKPTTVNNVETLAHVPGLLREGPAWFRELGAPGSGGTVLCTLPDSCARPGVHELPYSATLEQLIVGCGGGLRDGRRIKAILPALSSAFLPASSLASGLNHQAMRTAGSALGCGGISLLAEGQCVVERALEIARFFRNEQCGQCPPCRMETSTIAAVLEKLVSADHAEAGGYQAQIEKIAAFTARKGNCSLIEMAATPVLSALRLFPGDFASHAATGHCPV